MVACTRLVRQVAQRRTSLSHREATYPYICASIRHIISPWAVHGSPPFPHRCRSVVTSPFRYLFTCRSQSLPLAAMVKPTSNTVVCITDHRTSSRELKVPELLEGFCTKARRLSNQHCHARLICPPPDWGSRTATFRALAVRPSHEQGSSVC